MIQGAKIVFLPERQHAWGALSLLPRPERAGNLFPQGMPFPPQRGIVKQKKQQQEKAGINSPAINLLDADFGQPGHKIFHKCWQMDSPTADRYPVNACPVTGQVVRHAIRKPVAVKGGSHHPAHHHVEHIEHAQCLKKMPERHQLLQAGHERRAQNRVGKPAARHRQVKPGNRNI